MRFEIQGRKLTVTDALRTHIERRLQFALGRFGGRVASVKVCLQDINGPRNGTGMRCRIAVGVRPTGSVVIEDTDADLYAAVDRAADRAGRSVGRHLERARDRERDGRGGREIPT